jgi:hypothetical protein
MTAIEKLKAICDAATLGPWNYRNIKKIGPNVYITRGIGERLYLFDDDDRCPWGEGTALFIAAARTALPALIEYVEALEGEREVAKQYAFTQGYASATAAVEAAKEALEKVLS